MEVTHKEDRESFPEDVLFEEKLINAVSEREILYVKGIDGYRNKQKKAKVWQKVSEKTGRTAEECEKRWTTLRQRFTRELRKEDISTWVHFNRMLFLKEHIKARLTLNNSAAETEPIAFSEAENTVMSHSSDSLISVSDHCLFTSAPTKVKKMNPIHELMQKFEEKLENISSEPVVIHPHQVLSVNQTFMTTIVALLDELPLAAQDNVRIEIMEVINKYRKVHIHSKK